MHSPHRPLAYAMHVGDLHGGKEGSPAMERQGEDRLDSPSEGPLHQGRRDDRAYHGAAIRQPQGPGLGRAHDPVLHQPRRPQPVSDGPARAGEGQAPPEGTEQAIQPEDDNRGTPEEDDQTPGSEQLIEDRAA